MTTGSGSTTPCTSILVVDDDVHNRNLLTRRLSHEDYTITCATNGKEALSLMEVERFDVMLLDLNMPEMDGYQVLEWLKKNNQNHMRVIVQTATGDRDAVNTCLTLGASDYVLKSAGMIELMHRVQRACQDSALQSEQDENLPGNAWKEAHILVVDDDDMNRKLLRQRLEHVGLTISELNSGQAVMEEIKHNQVDLVLLDYHMPDIDGLHVLKQIRQMYGDHDISVIMVTAETSPDLIDNFYQAGADDYLSKPFHAAQLHFRIQSAVINKNHRQKAHRISELEELGKNVNSRDH